MCLSKRSELRHIDPKATFERGISLNALASEASLGTLISKAKLERGIPLNALASEVTIHSNKSVLEKRFLI